jgi:1,4-dihydroxy-6-naphthoate synthase
MKLTLGHSPDPDDAFMFYALAKHLLPTPGYEFEHILQDIQTLNERATHAELDITAISIHAYAYVLKDYALIMARCLWVGALSRARNCTRDASPCRA